MRREYDGLLGYGCLFFHPDEIILRICVSSDLVFVFFFQAEDGIRDHCVTGVQTCALPISGKSCQHIGTIRTGRLRRERDFLWPEVIALAQRKSQFFVTAVRIDQPAGNRPGNLVRVIDAVATRKLVLGEKLGEIEIGLRSIEIRQLILRTKWDVDVVEARLKRLQESAPPQIGLSLER